MKSNSDTHQPCTPLRILSFPTRAQPLLSALVPLWLADRASDGRRSRGVEKYGWNMEAFIGWSTDQPIDHLTLGLLKDYKRTLSMRVGPGSVRNAMSTLRAFCAWCVSEGLLADNPALHIPQPHVEPPDPDPLTRQQLTQLFAILDAPSRNAATWHRDRRAICLMLYAGLRIAEAAGVLWGDADLDSRRLTIRRAVAKGGKPRVIPICDELAEELAAAINQSPEGAIVDQGDTLRGQGQPLEPKSLGHLFERRLYTAGLDIHAHQLRKTFATELWLRGEDLATIQRLLGHADPKTTLRYLGACAQKERTAVAKLTLRAELGKPKA